MNTTYHPITFPRDSLAHGAITEWWYFNGHLRDRTGGRYGFMTCLFRVDPKKVKAPYIGKLLRRNRLVSIPYGYFAHSMLTDLSHKRNSKKIQFISLVSRDSFTRPLLFVNYLDPIAVSDYTNCEIKETKPFTFHIKNENLDLQLESKKPPLLVGGKGYVPLWNNKSYYYSLTDLRANGTITVHDTKIKVEGTAWMDHQWANIAYDRFHKNKWTWFSVQLKNGLDIMCVEYDNGTTIQCFVDMIDKAGRQSHYQELQLKPGQEAWHSRKTKAVYPLSWTIEIPDKKIKLQVRSLRLDYEMIFNTINYWEAPITVTGTLGGKRVTGVGFTELVGYPSDYNFLWLAGKEINKRIKKKLKQSGNKLIKKIGWDGLPSVRKIHMKK